MLPEGVTGGAPAMLELARVLRVKNPDESMRRLAEVRERYDYSVREPAPGEGGKSAVIPLLFICRREHYLSLLYGREEMFGVVVFMSVMYFFVKRFECWNRCGGHFFNQMYVLRVVIYKQVTALTSSGLRSGHNACLYCTVVHCTRSTVYY